MLRPFWTARRSEMTGSPGPPAAKKSPETISIRSVTVPSPCSVCRLLLFSAAVGHFYGKVAASCFTGIWICVRREGCVHGKCGKNSGVCASPKTSLFLRNLFMTKAESPTGTGWGYVNTSLYLYTSPGPCIRTSRAAWCSDSLS